MNTADTAVYSMEPNVPALLEATNAILNSAKATDEDQVSHQAGEKWFENLARLLLNWISQGRVDLLTSTRQGFRESIGKDPGRIEFLERFSPADRALIRVSVMEEFVNIFESTANDALHNARYSELLGGVQRQAWRKALIKLFVENRPMRASEFVPKVFPAKSTSDHVLERLTSAKLLYRSDQSNHRKMYTLTSQGRIAASHAQQIEGSGQPELKEGVFAFGALEARGSALEKVLKVGMGKSSHLHDRMNEVVGKSPIATRKASSKAARKSALAASK